MVEKEKGERTAFPPVTSARHPGNCDTQRGFNRRDQSDSNLYTSPMVHYCLVGTGRANLAHAGTFWRCSPGSTPANQCCGTGLALPGSTVYMVWEHVLPVISAAPPSTKCRARVSWRATDNTAATTWSADNGSTRSIACQRPLSKRSEREQCWTTD